MLGRSSLSLCTGCRDREEPLLRALGTWIACPEPDEIVVVDYGSRAPLREAIASLGDRRLLSVRVEEPHWQNARCHNLELLLARGDLFLHLDGDCLLDRSFFAYHPLDPRERAFYSGYWHDLPRSISDQCNLSGVLLAPRSHLLEANGYHEQLVHYGLEDDDLWHRLQDAGHRRRCINLATVRHLPHPDSSRYENLAIADQLGDLPSENLAKLRGLSSRLARSAPWTKADRMTRWAARRIFKRHLECRAIQPGETVLPPWKEMGP